MPEMRRDEETRPSPDALLQAARREESTAGRLKIFIGAAPGVGKTYEMLQQAKSRLREGIDVVVGVVETHGRRETEVLLSGLESVARRAVDHRGQKLEEMDLDAILARRPGLVLVDELAHTNAPGSRHPKRFLDVEELLDRGIDVYTTVNVQHIESLNDVVAQITHVRVRETVPDRVFDRAEAVELVDITPDDLIQRLKEGKVYVPRQAEKALEHFFSRANLTALRELALRRTAERVDDELLDQLKARAIQGPWAASERILVCINEEAVAPGLVRYGKRLADRLHAPFTVLSVETPRHLQLSQAQRDNLAETLRLGQALGAEPVTVPGGSRHVADDIIRYARSNNITQIVIGKSSRSRWFEILYGSVVHDLVRRADDISVHVIAGHDAAEAPKGRVRPQTREDASDIRPYAIATAALAAALGTGEAIWPVFGIENVDLVFLTAIVAIAVSFGLWPSLFATVLASLAYNFFFMEPLYTFTISDPRNIAAFVFFTVIAVFVSNVAARVRTQAVAAAARARATESLYSFSRKLAGVGTLDDVLWATAYQIALMLRVSVVLLLDEGGSIAVKAGYPPEDALDEADLAAAKWAWQNDRVAGRNSDTLPGARRLFLPMRTGRGAIGVVGIDSDRKGAILTPDERRLLDALIDQGALAIERVRLVEDIDRTKRAIEADRLRTALLTSISHDLKTPLSAVLGSAGTLRDFGDKLAPAERAELLGTVIDEAERLNRFIVNLLDMTKLESGAIVPNLAAQDIHDLVGAALRRAGRILVQHRVELDLAADLPMVAVDAVLFEQAIFNLLDNAAKYSPSGTTIAIRGRRERDSVVLDVTDEGGGIPDDEIGQIFEKFYRVRKTDQVRAGTGLGLAISRGFVEAMKGTITAANRVDRSGAVFTIRLPVPEAEILLDTAA